jgi:hypothetical protein
MCKDVCGHVTEFECASFEYSPVNRFCQLNDVNRWTAEENYVYFDQSWDYYHKTCYICRYICTILLLCYTKYCTILLLCYTKYTLCYTKYTLFYFYVILSILYVILSILYVILSILYVILSILYVILSILYVILSILYVILSILYPTVLFYVTCYFSILHLSIFILHYI